MNPTGDEVGRFAADLDALVAPGARIGLAVSGGPDSLALLLLATAARPGLVTVATVDHRLRASSAAEAAMVARLCAERGVAHHVLPIDWGAAGAPRSNVQARARDARYEALREWADALALGHIATAHHADDQAETLVMRMLRGAGLKGLAATRAVRELEQGVTLVRPLLAWRKAELGAVVARSGLRPVDDPANRDPRHDRTRVRAMLEEAEWADAHRLAASANWLAEADEALDWALAGLAETRLHRDEERIMIDPWGVPRELQRRLLLLAMAEMGAPVPRGPDLARALESLRAGRTVTLGGLKLAGGPRWQLARAAPRTRR